MASTAGSEAFAHMQIPALHTTECDELLLTPEICYNKEALIRRDGKRNWFFGASNAEQMPLSALLKDVPICGESRNRVRCLCREMVHAYRRQPCIVQRF